MSESRAIEPIARPGVLHGVALDLQPRELARMAAAASKTGSPAAAPGEAAEAARRAAANAEAHNESLRQARAEGYQEALRDLQQQGYQAGLEQGLKEGVKEGRTRGEEEVLQQARSARTAMQERIERLDQWLHALQAQSSAHLAQRLHAAEDELIAIAHAVICRMLGTAAFERASVGAMVRQAVEQCCGTDAAGSSADVTAIHVHPHDLEALQQDPDMAGWLAQQGASAVRWVPEPRVVLGGCIVQSLQGDLDARLETQLTALRHLLIDGRGRALP
jgi:flagellar assembly protein FliH